MRKAKQAIIGQANSATVCIKSINYFTTVSCNYFNVAKNWFRIGGLSALLSVWDSWLWTAGYSISAVEIPVLAGIFLPFLPGQIMPIHSELYSYTSPDTEWTHRLAISVHPVFAVVSCSRLFIRWSGVSWISGVSMTSCCQPHVKTLNNYIHCANFIRKGLMKRENQ